MSYDGFGDYDKYIAFFEKRGHKRIPNAPLVPENDPSTLFTSSGMQPLIPYLLGEPHPMGKKLVNVQILSGRRILMKSETIGMILFSGCWEIGL